ncbi:MAG: DUF2520 domain-containing protein [Rhodothermia bacterium]|nr:DUF2520 domain-containing protein [Rhodothermia bacterium]
MLLQVRIEAGVADSDDILRRIYLVGAGAAGSAIARALSHAGLALTGIMSRRADRAAELAKELGVAMAGDRIERFRLPALVIIAVPDDAIMHVAEEVAATHEDWSHSVVCHLSGAQPAAALIALQERGADAASFHPMVSLHADSEPRVFRGARLNIEGDEPAVAVCKQLATSMGAVPGVVDADTKLAIHLAASIASNYVVTLVSVATELLEREGVTPSEFETLLGPLVRSAVQNISFEAPLEALTGPVSRGDITTVRNHLEFVKARHREFLSLIANLVAETTHGAVQQGRISLEAAESLLDLVHEIIESSPS